MGMRGWRNEINFWVGSNLKNVYILQEDMEWTEMFLVGTGDCMTFSLYPFSVWFLSVAAVTAAYLSHAVGSSHAGCFQLL